jgi:hypothetical protein
MRLGLGQPAARAVVVAARAAVVAVLAAVAADPADALAGSVV